MVGIAVETMVTSTAAMKIESMHPAVTKRRLRMKSDRGCRSSKWNTLVVLVAAEKTMPQRNTFLERTALSISTTRGQKKLIQPVAGQLCSATMQPQLAPTA